MILKDRLQILDEVLKSAKTVLEQYEGLAEVASTVLAQAKVWITSETADPKDILDMFRRIHDMQMQALSTFNSILEKFPTEHTIQELQLLELFRNLTEKEKQALMLQFEQVIKQKRG